MIRPAVAPSWVQSFQSDEVTTDRFPEPIPHYSFRKPPRFCYKRINLSDANRLAVSLICNCWSDNIEYGSGPSSKAELKALSIPTEPQCIRAVRNCQATYIENHLCILLYITSNCQQH